jgi:hypothetical protein
MNFRNLLKTGVSGIEAGDVFMWLLLCYMGVIPQVGIFIDIIHGCVGSD